MTRTRAGLQATLTRVWQASASYRSKIPRWLLLELTLGLVLLGIAVALRLPHLMTVPALTDEFKEVGWALRIYRKHALPLVGFDAYDGPLFAYALALLFRLFGTSLILPRLFVMIVGALTVVLTFVLGKVLTRGDWRVGAAAALLLAANAHHILFNSHVAWSNDITPFFASLTFLAYVYATRFKLPIWLIVAGSFYGFALQTHPSVLALAPGLVVDFLLRRETRTLLRTIFPELAVLAALGAYSPVLYYNWQTGFDSLRDATTATYALETAPSLAGALANFAPQISAIGRVTLGSFASDGASVLWSDPVLLGFAVTTATALIWWARRGERFPLVIVSCALVFLAIFNRFSSIPDSARYFQFLTPLIFITWAQAGIYLCDAAAARGRVWRWGSGIALVSLLGLLCAASLYALQQYYADALTTGRNNVGLLQMVEAVRQMPQAPVLVEYKLAKIRTGRGGELAGNLQYFLRLDGRSSSWASITNHDALGGLRNFLRENKTAYLISFSNAPARLGDKFPLHPLVMTYFPCANCGVSNNFGLYWWEQP